MLAYRLVRPSRTYSVRTRTCNPLCTSFQTNLFLVGRGSELGIGGSTGPFRVIDLGSHSSNHLSSPRSINQKEKNGHQRHCNPEPARLPHCSSAVPSPPKKKKREWRGRREGPSGGGNEPANKNKSERNLNGIELHNSLSLSLSLHTHTHTPPLFPKKSKANPRIKRNTKQNALKIDGV